MLKELAAAWMRSEDKAQALGFVYRLQAMYFVPRENAGYEKMARDIPLAGDWNSAVGVLICESIGIPRAVYILVPVAPDGMPDWGYVMRSLE